MIPWFFFAESVNKGMSAIVSSAYLVKKVAFRMSILPLVKVLSSLGIHLVLVTLLVLAFLLHGFFPTVYWLQLPYYILCTVVLALGLGWLTSSIRVFVKDVGEIIGVVIQFGFWLTPIFWSFKLIPEQYHYIIKLNPMVYVVEGFRDTFIYQVWFWEKPADTLQFLAITLFFLVVGAIVFKRLRPHFGDVL
jgi:ABC-type polysaccharide/polyol phosphate export permease